MRPIDADALLEHLRKDPLFTFVGMYGIEGVIIAAPTIDPVKHGKWMIHTTLPSLKPFCSVCMNDSPNKMQYDYCPNCGARMDL